MIAGSLRRVIRESKVEVLPAVPSTSRHGRLWSSVLGGGNSAQRDKVEAAFGDPGQGLIIFDVLRSMARIADDGSVIV